MTDELIKYASPVIGFSGLLYAHMTYKLLKNDTKNTNNKNLNSNFSRRKTFWIFVAQILIWLLMLASNGYVFWELSESTEPLTRSDVVDIALSLSVCVLSLIMLMLVPTFYYVLQSTDQLRQTQLETANIQRELIGELSAAMGIAKNRQPEKIEKK